MAPASCVADAGARDAHGGGEAVAARLLVAERWRPSEGRDARRALWNGSAACLARFDVHGFFSLPAFEGDEAGQTFGIVRIRHHSRFGIVWKRLKGFKPEIERRPTNGAKRHRTLPNGVKV